MMPFSTDKRAGLDLEMLGREIEQSRLAGRRRVADLRPGIADRAAAIRRALVDRVRGGAHHDIEPVDREIEFFGGDLRERRLGAGADIDLAGEEGDGVVGMHREPGGKLAGVRRHAARDRPCIRRRFVRGQHIGRVEQAEGNDQAAREFEQAAPAEGCGHVVHCFSPTPAAGSLLAARSTARRMRIWVPQRHRLPSSACLMSSRVGCGFCSSSAWAVMIMPPMQ